MGAGRPNTPRRRTYPTFMLEIPKWAIPRYHAQEHSTSCAARVAARLFEALSHWTPLASVFCVNLANTTCSKLYSLPCWELNSLPVHQSQCWANRGPPEPGEWGPGGGIPGTPQILRKLLAPAIVQFDDHGKILRVFSNPFPYSRAHATVHTHRVRTQTNAEGAHKGRVWGVVLRQRKAPVRTAQPRVVSSAPAKTTLADRLLQGPLLAAQQLRTRPQLVAWHAHGTRT